MERGPQEAEKTDRQVEARPAEVWALGRMPGPGAGSTLPGSTGPESTAQAPWEKGGRGSLLIEPTQHSGSGRTSTPAVLRLGITTLGPSHSWPSSCAGPGSPWHRQGSRCCPMRPSSPGASGAPRTWNASSMRVSSRWTTVLLTFALASPPP